MRKIDCNLSALRTTRENASLLSHVFVKQTDGLISNNFFVNFVMSKFNLVGQIIFFTKALLDCVDFFIRNSHKTDIQHCPLIQLDGRSKWHSFSGSFY